MEMLRLLCAVLVTLGSAGLQGAESYPKGTLAYAYAHGDEIQNYGITRENDLVFSRSALGIFQHRFETDTTVRAFRYRRDQKVRPESLLFSRYGHIAVSFIESVGELPSIWQTWLRDSADTYGTLRALDDASYEVVNLAERARAFLAVREANGEHEEKGGRVFIVHGTNGKTLLAPRLVERSVRLALSEDAKHVALFSYGGDGDDFVQLLDVASGKAGEKISLGVRTRGPSGRSVKLEFSDDGKALLVLLPSLQTEDEIGKWFMVDLERHRVQKSGSLETKGPGQIHTVEEVHFLPGSLHLLFRESVATATEIRAVVSVRTGAQSNIFLKREKTLSNLKVSSDRKFLFGIDADAERIVRIPFAMP